RSQQLRGCADLSSSSAQRIGVLFEDLVAALDVRLGATGIGGRGYVKQGVSLVGMTFAQDADDNPLEFTVDDGFMTSERVCDQSQLGPRDDGPAQIDQRDDKTALMRPDPDRMIG